VAPEVLLKQPYNKKVDLWSIGIITYLLLTGYLPFDDDSSENVYKMTIYNPTPYPPILWNKISKEAKMLVNSK
jgi:serine/threonine protein kinase